MNQVNESVEVLDVVIIGGGLVGGLTALLLAQGGVQATVLDAAPILDAERTLAVANPRVLALSQATIHLLKTVDVWEKIARQMPYTGMQVWNKNGYGEINFGHVSEKFPTAQQSLGSMVEPSLLNLAIQQQML
ncbi:MAG: FAD-dependent monooxygenase, partial [Acinetobacter sp.]|uniref:FAD-dependent monooxygenase n=1 Tax=Acinetobacter sp. TaxID=472 RepID=UPI002FC82645